MTVYFQHHAMPSEWVHIVDAAQERVSDVGWTLENGHTP